MPVKQKPKNYACVWIKTLDREVKGWFLNGDFFDCNGKTYKPISWRKRESE